MAATLKHQTQRALSLYRYASCDHPLIVAWLDYQHAKSVRDGVQPAKARLKRELNIEWLASEVLEHAA